MPHPLPAIVIGGSLAGLMTGLALARAGIRVTLLERAPADRPNGAALAVDRAQLARAIGREAARRALAPATGRDPRTARNGSVPALWRDLHTGFRDAAACEPLIELRHNTPVVAVRQNADSAWATTGDGDTITAPVLIGADGHRSLVRSSTFPEHPDAAFAGYTLWLGIGEIPARSGVPDNLAILAADGYYLLGYPLPPDGSAVRRLGWAWYDATRNEMLRRKGSVRDHVVHHSLSAGDIPDSIYDELAAEAARAWPRPWSTAIRDSLHRRDVTCTPITEYVPERLARGRVALVGDAAHVPTPMTGMGFPTSLDDATAIARALADAAPESVEKALLTYEDQRLAAAQRLVRSGQHFSRSFAIAG
ncbi:FAD-dependent monooxygenase [Micromonospora sp. NPDC023633]|uniref:FAD-dependent monooxygenase n=1 Tax=Micromonospora sp. NPDC023633 TaxID=3154320 RepID=UPI0033FD9709